MFNIMSSGSSAPTLVRGQFQPHTATKLRPALAARQHTARVVVVHAASFDLQVRPYTLRAGDTLDLIAKKRSITTEQLLSINPGLKPNKALDGTTILLPANKLSGRDKEIIDGMVSSGLYRLYPMRPGETLQDVMSKRKISMAEMQALNPGIDLATVKDNQVLKLPFDKFTVREREMLIGSGVLPPEFFTAAKNPFVIGGALLMLVCGFVLAWQRFHNDADANAEA